MASSKPSPFEIFAYIVKKQQPIDFDHGGHELEQGQDLSKPGIMILEQLNKADLLALRATSTNIKGWVEADPSRYQGKVFRELNYHGNFKNEEKQQKSIDTLSIIAPHCKHLRIFLYNTSMAFGTLHLSLEGISNSFWMQVFTMLAFSLSGVAISAPGINSWDWRAYGAIEKQVGSIRVAMENRLTHGLAVLSLDPINAGALLYLRWRGASILSASAQAEAFWSRLVYLKIKMFNPLGHLTPTNSVDFLKTLHDFLGSFRRSLRGIHFEWLGPQGPSPLFLDMYTEFEGLFAAHPFQWSALTHARLENADADRAADFDVLRACRARRLRDLVVGGEMGLPASPDSVAFVGGMEEPPVFAFELGDDE